MASRADPYSRLLQPARGLQRPLWPFTVNWNSPQAAHLVFWAPIMAMDVGRATELARGEVATANSSPPIVSDTEMMWMYSNPATSYFRWTDLGLWEVTAPFEVMMWLRWNNENANRVIFERNQNTGYSLQVFLHEVLFSVGGTGEGSRIGTTAGSDDDVWHHYHFIVSGSGSGQGTVFVDGLDDTVDNSPGTPSYSGTTLDLGSRGSTFGFPGNIADVRIYNDKTGIPSRVFYDPRTRWDLYAPLRQPLWVHRVSPVAEEEELQGAGAMG